MDKVRTIETVAFNIALSACIPIALSKVISDTVWYSMLSTVLISFFSIFFFSRFFFKRFVVYKMKPIYRLVTSKSSTKDLTGKISHNETIMDEIRNELIHWSDKRAMEIARAQGRERFQREFIGDVLHEIKTPIFNIQGYLLTLLDGALHDPEINQLYLERAAKSLERLTNIIADLDEITKTESGEGKLNLTVFDIKALTNTVFSALEFEAEKKGIKLKLGPSASFKVMVYADRDRIEQVLINLITNSIKYGNPKGYTKVNFIDLYEETMIEVEDNGIGISEEDQKRLFERFYRVDKSRSREGGGTGLGLAIVKHLMEAHKTQLSVRSELDKGSVFSFTMKKPPRKEM